MQDEREAARVLLKIAQLLDSEVEQLSDEDGLGTHPGWNSLAHVEILATLEDECGLVIDAESIIKNNLGFVLDNSPGNRLRHVLPLDTAGDGRWHVVHEVLNSLDVPR